MRLGAELNRRRPRVERQGESAARGNCLTERYGVG